MQTTSGGMALLYYASQRIDVRRKEVIPGPVKDGPARGIRIRAKVVKNKVAAPHGQAIFDLYFDRGLDRTASMVDAAVQYGVMEKRSAYYYLSEEVTGNADAASKSYAQVRCLNPTSNAPYSSPIIASTPALQSQQCLNADVCWVVAWLQAHPHTHAMHVRSTK